MDKAHIIELIKRIASSQGGKAPGRGTFERETGIKMSAWYPHLWIRWGDALEEAGLTANQLQARSNVQDLIEKYVGLIRELKHIPVAGELKQKARIDKSFPNYSTIVLRLGEKGKMIDAVIEYSQTRPGHEDILELCKKWKASATTRVESGEATARVVIGFVYLMKSGKHFKIGRTISVGSRERQLAIKIPVPPTTIHSIETDDPVGIEAYWHKRFEEKRGEGEWFTLAPEDVRAFKRWKKIA